MERSDCNRYLKQFSHESKSIADNPMGNTKRRDTWVLMPFNDKEAKLVIYLLDGYFGNGLSMVADPGPIGSPLIHELILAQRDELIPPSLFVFVDASTRLGGSQYMNSISNGSFGDYCAIELPNQIDQVFGTQRCKRVLAGHSSGGYGALRLPIDYPGIFHGSIVSAADSLFDLSLRSHLIAACIQLEKSGGIDNFLKIFFSKDLPERCSYSDFQTLMILAMASCYSPAPHQNDAHCALPFRIETLEIEPAIWSQWLENDPLNFSDSQLLELGKLEHLHFDAGRSDEFAAQFGHRQLARRLEELGIPHIHEEFEGSHSGTRFRMRHRLQLLGNSLG